MPNYFNLQKNTSVSTSRMECDFFPLTTNRLLHAIGFNLPSDCFARVFRPERYFTRQLYFFPLHYGRRIGFIIVLIAANSFLLSSVLQSYFVCSSESFRKLSFFCDTFRKNFPRYLTAPGVVSFFCSTTPDSYLQRIFVSYHSIIHFLVVWVF